MIIIDKPANRVFLMLLQVREPLLFEGIDKRLFKSDWCELALDVLRE